MISLPFSLLLLALFLAAAWEAQPWPLPVKQFPLVAALSGAALLFFIVMIDAKGFMATPAEHGSYRAGWAKAAEDAVLGRALMFFGYLVLMILVMLVIGQKLALPLFIALYLRRWGEYSWRIAIAYAVGGWVLLIGFYDRIMHLFWYPSLLGAWLSEVLPSWLPTWLYT